MATKLIQYHNEDRGWFTGYLIRRGYKWTRIERILPYKINPTTRGRRSKFLKVATVNTREVEQ